MNIYIDFDDCLCETARCFSLLAKDLFDINVPYENIAFFNLQKTFSLSDDKYEELMIEGHKPEVLLAYEETPGASETVKEWLEAGHDVSIITGRPYSVYEPSREWLDRHGLGDVKMYCLDKYGRDNFIKGGEYSLKLEDYYKMHFDFAVEDSPKAFRFFDHLPDMKVMVYDRPWNHNTPLPGPNFTRCYDWEMIKKLAKGEAL